MFMVGTEPWPSGTSNRSVTIGEQLNTPEPATNGDICGFEFGSIIGGQGASRAAKVNLTNVFSKNDNHSITEIIGGDFNNNNTSDKRKELLGSFNGTTMEPPFSTQQESVITAGFGSWEFEPCLDETLLSPISYMATPHHSSTGVASPGSSSGDTDLPDHLHHQRKTLQESETCVDFNSVLFSPSSPIIEASEEDDLCMPLHEEIEQLSSSFYCTSNNLVLVNTNPNNNTIDVVSPSILKLLQEEDQPQPPAPSIVATNSFFSDANDGEDVNDEEQQQHVERKQSVEVVAAEKARSSPQNASSYTDETLDVKTQTQLEHNYTIQLPYVGSSPTLKKHNTVKEANLALAKSRESLKPPQATPPQQRRPINQSVKRQLFQRMKSRMATEADLNRKVPNLKLKIINATQAIVVDESALMTTTQMVLNTPDITENVLDLEDEFLIKEENFDLLKYIDSATGYDVIHSPEEEKPPVATFTEPASTTICAPTLSDLFNPAKRKLPPITIESLDELTSSSNAKRFRSTASSTASSICGDNASEASASTVHPTPKRRGRPPKPVSSVRDRSEYEHLNETDMRYREQRDKNNEASRKSRINRKDRESKLEEEAGELVQKYEVLEEKEQELIRECARWRKAVMRLALL